MNKKALIELVLIELKRQHQTLFNSALEAKSAATDEESKAENKYDTRGLEASYLAGAQAKRTTELEETIKVISDFLKTESFFCRFSDFPTLIYFLVHFSYDSFLIHFSYDFLIFEKQNHFSADFPIFQH